MERFFKPTQKILAFVITECCMLMGLYLDICCVTSTVQLVMDHQRDSLQMTKWDWTLFFSPGSNIWGIINHMETMQKGGVWKSVRLGEAQQWYWPEIKDGFGTWCFNGYISSTRKVTVWWKLPTTWTITTLSAVCKKLNSINPHYLGSEKNSFSLKLTLQALWIGWTLDHEIWEKELK